jgi:hypothetical protein
LRKFRLWVRGDLSWRECHVRGVGFNGSLMSGNFHNRAPKASRTFHRIAKYGEECAVCANNPGTFSYDLHGLT